MFYFFVNSNNDSNYFWYIGIFEVVLGFLMITLEHIYCCVCRVYICNLFLAETALPLYIVIYERGYVQ